MVLPPSAGSPESLANGTSTAGRRIPPRALPSSSLAIPPSGVSSSRSAVGGGLALDHPVDERSQSGLQRQVLWSPSLISCAQPNPLPTAGSPPSRNASACAVPRHLPVHDRVAVWLPRRRVAGGPSRSVSVVKIIAGLFEVVADLDRAGRCPRSGRRPSSSGAAPPPREYTRNPSNTASSGWITLT